MSGHMALMAGPRRYRRATVYIAVLGIALLVTVIGLSGLLLARVEQRSATDMADATRADFCAQSAIDLALFILSQQSNWRTIYVDKNWTAEAMLDDVSYSFRLADELDGNLVNNETQPVRLYAKATCRQTMRMYSVLLQPNIPPNLLKNPSFENGQNDWSGKGCDLDVITSNPHTGAACIRADSRNSIYDGPCQYIDEVIENGKTYRIEGWVRVASGDDCFKITINTDGSGSGDQWFGFTSQKVQTGWKKISGVVTPTWSGTLNEAYYCVETTDHSDDFYADDLVLIEENPDPPLIPVPGSWRREVDP